MKDSWIKNILGFVFAFIYLFSADIVASLYASPYISEGQISNGLRLPAIAGGMILIVLMGARIFKIANYISLILSGVISFVTILLIIFGPYHIGLNINAFQLLWYIVSSFALVIIFCMLLLVSVGILKEEHLKKWIE
ncbi:hypothetical protein [Paenibacillus chitinolyticus]|uniref:hypothetical protein n=1 Tax=Paenibacillus chitinolyticus TaxID=79263 RepID=UPI001C47CB03|nr:hypothetical protein [Paenibacillus chitinolyticus]MBV6717243.1 hypothetical protein [Paenibacillus chitinolyticus]